MQQDTPAATEQQAHRARRTAAPKPSDKHAAFVHVPYPPYVHESAEYSDQRYFSRNNSNFALKTKGGMKPEGTWSRGGEYFRTESEVDVYRNAKDDTVDLRIEQAVGNNRATVSIACTAAELREIANRLLDAAHDLDTLPSRVLAQGGAA